MRKSWRDLGKGQQKQYMSSWQSLVTGNTNNTPAFANTGTKVKRSQTTNTKVATEFKEQCMLVNWLRKSNILFYAIPNGGKRPEVTGFYLKASGMQKGVPDLCIPIPRGKFGACYVEMKSTGKSKVSPEQQDWINKLQASGNYAVIAKGFLIAKELIENYLRSPCK